MTRQELVKQIYSKGTFLCVGLDADIRKIPSCLLRQDDPVFAFNRAIIDATAPYCVAYKPNTAFYESQGPRGVETLYKTVEYIRANYPDHLIIADAKRGDIGNTSAMYAREYFETMNVDAVTVAPYMGRDSVSPFLGYEGKWVILLALTSNSGSADFQQFTDSEGTRLFERVLTTAQTWSDRPDETMMFVVGATRGAMFEDIRRLAPRSFLLVPGIGAQGGSLEEVVRYGMINGECGLLVNSSRGIIYASTEDDFAEAAAKSASALASEMKNYLK